MELLNLILRAQREGLSVSLASNGDLELRGDKVIRDKWRPRLLAHRHGIVAALRNRELPIEFEVRLRNMAKRWMYTASEIQALLASAKAEPGRYTHLVELDERDFGGGDMWLSLG